jgi:hypothetical protein
VPHLPRGSLRSGPAPPREHAGQQGQARLADRLGDNRRCRLVCRPVGLHVGMNRGCGHAGQSALAPPGGCWSGATRQPSAETHVAPRPPLADAASPFAPSAEQPFDPWRLLAAARPRRAQQTTEVRDRDAATRCFQRSRELPAGQSHFFEVECLSMQPPFSIELPAGPFAARAGDWRAGGAASSTKRQRCKFQRRESATWVITP